MDDPRLLTEYFKRCFVAVDGLWFMMVEKEDSFEKALELDRRVWGILPKIQARKIKELFKMEATGPEDLVKAFKFKLYAEDFISEFKQEASIINRLTSQMLCRRISDFYCRPCQLRDCEHKGANAVSRAAPG